MGGVEVRDFRADALERIDDEHVRRRWRRVLHDVAVLGIVVELFERFRKVARIAAKAAAAFVGRIFAAARNRHLNQARRNRRQENREQAAEPAAVIIVAASAEEERHLRRPRDDARDGRRDARRQDVAVLHMRELVREHARELLIVQHAQDARRHGDRCMLGIAPRRECIRHVAFNDGDRRHREARPLREALDEPVELRRILARDFLRAIRPQHHRRTEPVRAEIHRNRNHEHQRSPRRPADRPADRNHDAGEECHQKKCLHRIHEGCPLLEN